LWAAIKLEVGFKSLLTSKMGHHLRQIFHPADSGVEAGALSATQALIRTIYGNQDVVAHEFAQDICTECIQVLREPEKSQAKAAIKVICALLSTTGTFLSLLSFELWNSLHVKKPPFASTSFPRRSRIWSAYS
jgi:hypothetical protein